jgi:hypothetical protein
VFGVTNPVPDWRNAVLIGGSGHFSPYRLLKYPIEGYLEHFLFYCRPSSASLNQAWALPGVMHGRASVMA